MSKRSRCGAAQMSLEHGDSRCGAVRMCLELGEPSAEIVRVEALSLWRRANVSCARRTLCGDRACQSALAVAPCEFGLSSANPLRRSCASKRSICLELGEPSAEIVCVEALSLWRRASLARARRTLCGDRACRSALAVAPCECVLSSANPLRRSCVSKRSRCGAVRMCLELGKPSAEIVRVEALSLWHRARCDVPSRISGCAGNLYVPSWRAKPRICGSKFATSRCKK